MAQFIRIVLLFAFIVPNVLADRLEIKINQDSFDVPYWPAKEARYGAVLIVRGGQPIQWSPFLAGVAKKLSRNGWSVVLLNCDPGISTPWISQLPEIISVLRQDKNSRIVLVHYGDELNQSLDYFSKPQSKMVNGLVMISAYGDIASMENPPSLRFPLFDIAGQFDYDNVLSQMILREKGFKDRNYLSLELPGARHDYEYSQQLLVAYVHGWMSKLPEFRPQPRPILVSYIEPLYSLVSHIASIRESDWYGFINNPKDM